MTDQLVYAVVIMVVVASSIAGAVLAPAQAPAIIGLGTLICVQLLNLLNSKKTAEKVETVATKLDAVQVTTDATHTLSNSGRGALLLLSRSQSRRLADLTHDPIDAEAADVAESIYRDHMASQQIVDSGGTIAIPKQRDEVSAIATAAALATPAEKVEVVITGDAVQVTTAEKPKESK